MSSQRFTEERHKLTGNAEFDKFESTNYYDFYLKRAIAIEETERQVAAHATERTKRRWAGAEQLAKELWSLPMAMILAGALRTFFLYLRSSVVESDRNAALALPVQIKACAEACTQRGTSMHEYSNATCECK